MNNGTSPENELDFRRADESELEQIIDCCGDALAWDPSEPNADFFRWKHRDNPFGPSSIWVAADRDRIVGVRTMMRWRLVRGSEELSMVRAVDTATRPSHQGRGIFSRLTKLAVKELTAEGVDAVFNTPNDKSRPGYLKMGWTDVGRVPVSIRLRSPLVVPRMLRSRVAAGKWGEEVTLGTTKPDHAALASAWHASDVWHTPVTADYLAWRYGFEPLGYRFVDGAAIRVRTRGAIRELSICDVFDDPLKVGKLMQATNSDVAISATLGPRHGFVPAPPLGPRLTWRTLKNLTNPELDQLALSIGTIELF